MGRRGEIFTTVEMRRPNYNTFDLSYDHKLSFKMGKLVPVHVGECVPGDKFNISCSSMLRLAPMVAPVMHRVNVFTHFFFVPNRLIWDNWESFIAGSGEGFVRPALPVLTGAPMDIQVSSLGDYLGLPVFDNLPNNVSALPFAAYQCIYNEYYRDQNLVAEVDYQLADGDNTGNFVAELGVLRTRAWQHDYLTSALPWAQKGDPVSLPIAGFSDVPVVMNPTTPWNQPFVTDLSGLGLGGALAGDGGGTPVGQFEAGGVAAAYNPANSLIADTSSLTTTAVTINDLRRAEQLQVWLENNARGGTRYTESNLVHFGVRSPDARLQRPEYIGGTKNPMVISEVLQNSETDTTPQGTMTGHGVSVGSGGNMSYYCQEHGWIIGIMSVMPETAYQQGVPRHWRKQDPFDYYWPEFANIGEQEILNSEVYLTASSATNNEVFGYAPRYAEYRYSPSTVSGEFQSTLNFWHMGRIFTALPTLNQSFIEADPTRRIFADTTDNDKVWAHVFHNIRAKRLMPRFGVPTL